jgi:hypothetical protein
MPDRLPSILIGLRFRIPCFGAHACPTCPRRTPVERLGSVSPLVGSLVAFLDEGVPVGTHPPLPTDAPRPGAAAAARDVRLEPQPRPHQRRILPISLRRLPAHLAPPLLTARDAGFSGVTDNSTPFLTSCSTLGPKEMIKSGAQALKESSRGGRPWPSRTAPAVAPRRRAWYGGPTSRAVTRGGQYLWPRIPRPGVPCNDSGVSRDVGGKRS